MERNREARRSNLAPSNGLPRRRHRSNNLRDSPEHGEVEMQETARLRERANKRERDRDLLNRSKRKRADKVVLQGSNNREEGEESTEESSGEEEDYETEQLSNRKISPSARLSRQGTPMKATDEIISFPVPRKARSASVKRSHESWVAGNGGYVEEPNHRQASISPARRSIESDRVSPPSSNGSVRKKMKTNGPKTRLPKTAKPSISAQEDIEIEIAEVLYGLMKQSQSSKKDDKDDSAGNHLPKLESEDANVFSTETKPSVSPQIANSEESPSQTTILPDSLVGAASKKKVESEDSPSPVKVENDQRAKLETCQGQISGVNAIISESSDKGAAKTASVLTEASEKVVMIKQGDSKPSVEEPNSVDGAVTREKSVSTEKESAELDVDFPDSTETKAMSTVSKVESQREEKFKIDLMAPPPMISSPERDGSVEIALDPKYKVQDMEPKVKAVVKDESKVVKKEMRAEDGKDKVDAVREKRDSLNFGLEKHQDSGSDCCKFEHSQKQQLSKPGIPKVEKTTQSSSVPGPITLPGWPNGLPPLGYMPPFPTIAPVDGSTKSSAVLQPPHLFVSQPRPKRCAMHHSIARNIHLHQQFTKMNQFWPSAPGSAPLCGPKPNNLNAAPSADNLVLGNPLQGRFPVVNLNSTEEKGKAAASFPGLTRKDKSSDCANLMDAAQKKQVVQQASQPPATGHLMHGPAFILSLSQHQATPNQSGPSKCATSTNKASLTNNSTSGISTSSTALPGVAAAVSFNYPNLGANEAPYLTILPNNGYPFAISAPVGNPPAIRGGTPSQALPFFNGSFYSSQMFHPPLQQQQSHSQPGVQPTYQNAVASSGSSTSHKQPESQQPRGGQVNNHNFLSSTSPNSQQLQKYHMLPSSQSRKMEAEMNGENTTSSTQKSVYGQNPPLPHPPVNFALLPSTAVGGGNMNGNHCEKQQSQQKNLKGGVDLVPPQAFAMSFASFTGNNITSNLNFSSMAQSPTLFHSLPEMARQGYQVASVPVPQAEQQKKFQISDGKNGADSKNLDDGKKVSSGKSQTTNGQTYVFDNSARSLNFVSSPVTGNWPPCSITSTIATANPVVANLNSQQQQLLQLQKQHMLQHQQQPATASRSKTQTTNTLPASSIAAKFSGNAAMFPQTVPQGNCSAQASQWKNSARTTASQMPCTSVAATNISSVKSLPQQQSRPSQGQNQISFGVNTKSVVSPQVQEIPSSGQSVSPMIVGSPPSSGNLRPSSAGGKVGSSVPTLQSQQSENSSSGNGQKSSPVCGRNVPSILSACPSHLSELKY